MSSIQIELTRLSNVANPDSTSEPVQYQTLSITQTIPWQPILPSQLATIALPSGLDLSREVVLYGRLPNWFYGRLVDLCRTAPWIGCYNGPAGGIVIIHSGVKTPVVGDLIPVQQNQSPCPAIAIVGPPNSGKSVFSNALRASLIRALPDRKTYLHRASWDGEGNWAYEANTPMVEQFIRRNEFRIHEDPETAKLIPDYYRHHARVVENLRMLSDCVLVDMGGMPQPEKQPLLDQCTHYIIISRLASALKDWHQCCAATLEPIAVIHSVLKQVISITQTEPVLEVTAGPWVDSASIDFPECILEKCTEVYRMP
ncbi:hypothetical protein BH23CYA1_BH23CYA1_24130 [soil metagenome]